MTRTDLGEAGFLTANGSYDSHTITLAKGKPNDSPKAGTPYNTITWDGIRGLMDRPAAVEKADAAFVILSTYNEHDGRTHDVQRERGVYGGLAVDIDKGDPSIEEVISAVTAVVGDCCLEVYSSSSAAADNRKWRVLVPLAVPLAGSEYHETQDAFFSLLGKHGLQCCTTLARTGQPIYLPNVPKGRRDGDGRPLFYECRHVDGPALKLGPKSAIVDAIEHTREQLARLQAEAAEAAAAKKAAWTYDVDDDFKPIAHFNANHAIGDLLVLHGFVRKEHADRKHYRHDRLGDSGSYSMEDMGDHWVCMSHWAKDCKLGSTSRDGFQFGDAFDLFCYFEHGNDQKVAVRTYAEKVRPPAAVKVTTDNVPTAATSARRTDVALQAVVVSASAAEDHSGGTDLYRPHTWEDVGLARRLAKQIRGRLAYVRERAMWRSFDGKRWAERADHIAVQEAKRLHDQLFRELAELAGDERSPAVVRFVQSTGTKTRIDAMVSLARSEPGINVSQDEFDTHPWLLNVQNGVLDLRSGELRPHDPSLRITQLAAVSFDPHARSELWERTIRDVTCGDSEIEHFLQQAYGLALTGDVSDEVLICHNGGGCNGKSTVLEAIGAMLGDYAAVAPPGLFTARNFDSHPTEIAALHGKRFVTAIEQEANRALRESLVKSLTGGDTIRTRRMREDFWEMKPTWHIHIAYNRAPRLSGTDDGIRRRLRVVPWAASFKDRPDLTIKERLIGPDERSGILAWCLEGLRRRLLAGRLESPAAVMLATDEYIDDEDLVGRFIADCCVEGPREEAEIRETLAAFKRWMQADGTPRHVVDSHTANMLGRELARRGFGKRRPDVGPHRKRTVYIGLRVTQDCEYAHTAEDWPDPFSR